MRNPFRRRWLIEKYDKRNNVAVVTDPPEPGYRRFWTYSGALVEAERLNHAQIHAGRPWRFRIVRLP
jgi:hypothetical protein